ncbi:MAG TPA: tetratricopeptide repeat protein [Hanamia sp.]|nr:tetratricopeptide repeat protein [Hanamia sp.]
MRKISVLFCFIFIFCDGFSQKKIIDSLQNELKSHSQKDTIRINILSDLAFYYEGSDPDKGLQSADEAISLAMLLKDEPRLATAYNYKGLNYTAQSNDSVALQYFNKCLTIRNQLNDEKGIGSVLHNMGTSYFNLSDYSLSLEYHQKAYNIFKKVESKKGMAASLNSTGTIFLYLSDYPKALNNYLEALHIFEQSGDEQNTGVAYTNIGLVYNHLSDYKKSFDYQMKALNIFKKSGDQYQIQNTLGNIGNMYDDSGHPDKALSYYQQAMAINEKMGNNRGIASNLINMGIVYNGISDYNNALKYLQKSYTLYQQLKDKYGMSIALSYISNTYFKAPAAVLKEYNLPASQRFEKAIALQQEGLKLARETGNLSTESDGWGNLSDIYTSQKDFAKALDAYKKHTVLQDSIFSNEKKSEITRMMMQYDFNKKETASKVETDKNQALALAEIERQRIVKNAIAIGAGIIIVASIITFIFYKRKRDAEERRKEAEFKVQVSDTEMKALRAQMNPHFIFNSLNSIRDYMANHNVKKADHYLSKFAKMVRMVLENSEHKQVSLAEDLKVLELYIQLEALRLEDKFSYEIKVDEQIDQEITMVPPLILQPFVENSIWHGIAKKEGKGKILIEIKKEAEMINCLVEDDGIGRKRIAADEKNKRSFGMKITKSRIDLLSIPRRTKGTVKLSDLANGMRVEVKFPLALNY